MRCSSSIAVDITPSQIALIVNYDFLLSVSEPLIKDLWRGWMIVGCSSCKYPPTSSQQSRVWIPNPNISTQGDNDNQWNNLALVVNRRLVWNLLRIEYIWRVHNLHSSFTKIKNRCCPGIHTFTKSFRRLWYSVTQFQIQSFLFPGTLKCHNYHSMFLRHCLSWMHAWKQTWTNSK